MNSRFTGKVAIVYGIEVPTANARKAVATDAAAIGAGVTVTHGTHVIRP